MRDLEKKKPLIKGARTQLLVCSLTKIILAYCGLLFNGNFKKGGYFYADFKK